MNSPLATQPQTLEVLSADEKQSLLETAFKQYQASNATDLMSGQVSILQNSSMAIANRILAGDPINIDALNLMARIELDKNNLAAASQWVDTALAVDNRSGASWYTHGQIALAMGSLSVAESSFVRSIELAPHFFRAHTSYAFTKLEQGQLVPAFQHYRKLARIQPGDAHVRAKLFECLRQLKADFDNQELADDLCEYLRWDDVNHNDLASMTASLLIHRYRLEDDDAELDIARLIKDPLLTLALEKLFFTNPTIEKVMTMVREYLLHAELQQHDRRNEVLIAALGCQGCNNEYVYPISAAEQAQLDQLTADLQVMTKSAILRQQHLVALAAMYASPAELLSDSIQTQIAPDQWRDVYRPLMTRSLYGPRRRAGFDHFRVEGNIVNAVSCAVKEQYEHNPYPRWLALDYHTPTTYPEALQKTFAHFRPGKALAGTPLKILVAGCGTGRQALQIARYFRDTQVTAVDISRASLQYAGDMAEQYGLRNIQFIQADILELERLGEQFHIIECSGVLHHMEDPAAGARALLDLLVPNGLMKLGLYSERARSQIVDVRQQLEASALTPSADNIRQLRSSTILADMCRYSDIVRAPDFYTMSGCRDLLMHVQEHRFTPAQLQQMIAELGVDFIGFSNIPAQARKQYRDAYPTDSAMTDLLNWEIFEQQHPATFAAMYQFYLQK